MYFNEIDLVDRIARTSQCDRLLAWYCRPSVCLWRGTAAPL